MGIAFPLLLIFFTCLLIWRACDGFEVASEYIGRNLSEGVRGGTINAISSSLPELFTTLIALFLLSDANGFSVGIGTTAGSALFNGMIIPAACIFTVCGSMVLGVKVTSVNVSTKVLLRDGLSLIFCEAILIFLISGNALHWWQGAVLIALYVAYFSFMILSMKKNETATGDDGAEDDSEDPEDEAPGTIGKMFYWLSGGPLMNLEQFFVKEHHKEQIRHEKWNGWPLLLTSTAVIAASCWMLVVACEWLGSGAGNEAHQSYSLFGYEFTGFGWPTMFVAVIFASMATSVPDTVMSIRDARDGDYDDAVANALGSNIFDICFALGFPLLLFTLLNGPIKLDPEVARQSAELRFLLLCLTVLGFSVYYIGSKKKNEAGIQYVEMRRGKAVVLTLLYLFFVGYVLGLSEDAGWAIQISDGIQSLLARIPKVG